MPFLGNIYVNFMSICIDNYYLFIYNMPNSVYLYAYSIFKEMKSVKTSKRILSALLSLCMILGCVAVGFTAQAAEATLQDGINAAIANGDASYEWNGGNVTLEDTLVINGDIKVDLNNATVTGAPGKTVVNVKGGNVELYNGTFIAVCESYKGVTAFAESLMDYRPAVSINGGNVTLDCITAVGSTIRVPNSSSVKVTTGNGINANAGTVVLKDVIAVGMKALDNTKAQVTVEDAILVGIYKAANIYSKVNFAEGYTQYKTVEFLEEFLKDGVTLSATEKKYISGLTNSEGDLSVASVVVSVKDPELAQPVSTYDAETDVLTVTAYSDVANEKADVANRYSYKYTPVTCTIDGVTADFADQEDGSYVATFENVAAGKTLAAELDYTLSVKMGKQQKDVVVNGLDMIAAYAEKAPEIIGRFIEDFEGDRAYGKVKEYMELAFNAYFDSQSPVYEDDRLKPIIGIIYALGGHDYDGFVSGILRKHISDASKRMLIKDNVIAHTNTYGKIFDTDGDGIADSVYAFFGDTYGEGIGLLELFDTYYEDIKALALTADYKEFNDIGAAAEYIGKYYGEFIELIDAAIELLEYGYEILDDEDIRDIIASKFPELEVVVEYADKFMAKGGYYEKLVAKYNELKTSDFLSKYADRAPELCKRYALKALDIAQNPTKYFDINSKVEGDYLNMFSFKQTAEFETPSDVEMCNVTVKLSGYGKFMVEGKEYAIDQTFSVPMGELFTVTPVEYDESVVLFKEFFYTQPNSEWKVIENIDNFRIGSDIVITVCFTDHLNTTDDLVNIFFLTDANLSFNRIGQYNNKVENLKTDNECFFDNQYNIIAEAPVFKGLEFKGWSLDKDCSPDNALSYGELLDEVSGRIDDFFVYAVYENNQDLDVPSGHEELAVINAEADPETSRVYFLMSVEAPENIKVIEIGVIATKNTDYVDEAIMTLELRGTPGVVSKFADTADVKGDDGYLKNSCGINYGVKTASGTIYGRGYVIYKDLDTNTIETYYTDIVSDTL